MQTGIDSQEVRCVYSGNWSIAKEDEFGSRFAVKFVSLLFVWTLVTQRIDL